MAIPMMNEDSLEIAALRISWPHTPTLRRQGPGPHHYTDPATRFNRSFLAIHVLASSTWHAAKLINYTATWAAHRSSLRLNKIAVHSFYIYSADFNAVE